MSGTCDTRGYTYLYAYLSWKLKKEKKFKKKSVKIYENSRLI